jgi:hypothetical protein
MAWWLASAQNCLLYPCNPILSTTLTPSRPIAPRSHATTLASPLHTSLPLAPPPSPVLLLRRCRSVPRGIHAVRTPASLPPLATSNSSPRPSTIPLKPQTRFRCRLPNPHLRRLLRTGRENGGCAKGPTTPPRLLRDALGRLRCVIGRPNAHGRRHNRLWWTSTPPSSRAPTPPRTLWPSTREDDLNATMEGNRYPCPCIIAQYTTQ